MSSEQAATEPRTPPPAPAPPSLGDAARGCELIQRSSNIQAYCETRVINGGLLMMTRFDSQEMLDRYFGPIAKEIAEPFCAAATQQGLSAQVSVELMSRKFRLWNCGGLEVILSRAINRQSRRLAPSS